MSIKKRLDTLSSTYEAQQARRADMSKDGRGDALAGQCLALAALLPDAQRAAVEARGARGYAQLLEGHWLSANRARVDFTPEDALTAYRLGVEDKRDERH